MNKSFLSSLILLILLILNSNSKPIDPTKVVIALNCGAKTQQISSVQAPFKYIPDQNFVKGSSVDVDYHNDAGANEAQIKYTLDKQVYMYQRHTYQQMIYELPVKKGKNTLILKFTEMYFKTKGQRVFDIKIGQSVILQNFDVIQKSGSKYAAHQEFIEIDVKSDGVYHNNIKLKQGLVNNKLKLSFAKGKADNPIIQAIIVYHDTVENSPKQQFLTLKSKWNTQQQMLKAKKQEKELKELILIQKKKQKIVIRNDQLVIEEDLSKQSSQAKGSNNKYGTVRSLLMGPIGILVWAAFFGYFIYFTAKKIFNVDLAKISKSQ